MRQIQEILGYFQDQTVLRQFLESKLQSPVAKALPTIELMTPQEEGDLLENVAALAAVLFGRRDARIVAIADHYAARIGSKNSTAFNQRLTRPQRTPSQRTPSQKL